MKKEKDTKTQNNTPENGKKQKKGLKIVKFILNTLINIMIVGVLVISLVVAVLAITSKNSQSGLPNVFGYTLQYVETNSMSTPSPDGYEGGCFTNEDVIIGRVYDVDNPVDLEVGDIITFNSNKEYDANNQPLKITHRIVDKVELTPNHYRYQTWGDNREIAEVPDQAEEKDYIGETDIIAYNYTEDYHGTTIKGMAGLMRTLRSQTGFFGFILVPMIIFFFYAIIRVVISTIGYKKSKSEEEKENAEKEKDEAVKAAVAAALAAQQEASNKDDAKPAEAEAPDKAEAAAPPDTAETAEKTEKPDDKPAEKTSASPEMTPEELEQFRQFQEFQKMQKAQQDAKDGK